MAWKMQLTKSMKDPNLIVFTNDLLTVIKDKFPKAEKHFLVLPEEDITGINKLTRDHIELLRGMVLKGREIAREHGEGRKFRYGFHAIPSLQRLHLHVISDDFNSTALKTAKHWNSFNTSFFIDSEKVIKDLESAGKVLIPSKMECDLLLKTPLKCHKCNFKPKNMPTLKSHLLEHSEKA